MTPEESGFRAAQITVGIVDALATETDGPAVMTGLGAVVVVELDRFGATIEAFAASLHQLKADRDAEIARRRKEN